MIDILKFIGDYTLMLNALALIAFTVLTIKVTPGGGVRRLANARVFKFTSFSLVMISVVCIDLMHSYISFKLRPLFGNPDYADVIGIYWYMSFAVTDLLMVIFVSILSTKLGLLRDRATKSILIIYIFLAMVQIVTFFDTWVLKSLTVYNVYPVLIVTSNVFVSVIAWCFVVRLALKRVVFPLFFFFVSLFQRS